MARNPTRNRPAAGGRTRLSDWPTRVATLAHNLWWTWNPDPQRLFAAMDPALWETCNHNPLHVLLYLSPERWATLDQDEDFHRLLAECERQLAAYLRARTWFQRTAAGRKQRRVRVAYFCAEFGIHESLPIYAGGLGVLAGDHLKSASDLGIPLVGVGLLYRCGYYRQELRADGSTRVVYPRHNFDLLPVLDTGHRVDVPLARRVVVARVWLAQIGRVPLYLLDTDLPDNARRDRAITERLYGGDRETRIQQEIVLGVGGARALDLLRVNATAYHLNEGHAAFCGLERLSCLRAAGARRESALARVRTTTVFTTHTPVPAGHDRFPPRLARRYLAPLLPESGMSMDELLGLGREKPGDRREPLCMTVLALRLAERCNGVAAIHGRVSREMWRGVFETTDARRVPIGHVTNGVHAQTWLAPEMLPLYEKYLRPRWVGAGPDDDWWARAKRIPPAEMWAVRQRLRSRLVEFVRERLRQQIARRCGPIEEMAAALEALDANSLTIGFSRRFATYKRATLIFSDRKRLARILNHPKRPVQIIFAGKAHPADAGGQELLRQVYLHTRESGFRGRVVLLEDYDINVGRILTSGCDVWLNNPRPPQEASGTSGMKPPLHGGLNCSILDGWWPEAYDGRNGWAISTGEPARGRRAQDRQDAADLYRVLEEEIAPLFYDRDRQGIPRAWVRRMIASMSTVCGQFNTHRMLAEYLERYAGESRS